MPTLRNAVSQHLIKNFIAVSGDIQKLNDDPRTAVLQYADKSEGQFFGKAYKDTQPLPVFQPHPTDEEEAEHAAALAADAHKRERARQEAEKQAERKRKSGM